MPTGLTVRTRLLAALILPLLLVALLVGQVVVNRQGTVHATNELRARTLVVADLAALRTQIFEERRQFETVARSAEVGVDPVQVGELLGMEVVSDLGPGRAETNVALRRLAASDRPFSAQDLAELRTGIDARSSSTMRASRMYAELEMRVVGLLGEDLTQISASAVEIGDLAIERTVRTMAATIDLVGLRGRQLEALARRWFPLVEAPTPALVALAQATGLYDDIADHLDQTTVGAVAAAWRALDGKASVFEAAIADELAGRTGVVGEQGSDLRTAGTLLGDGLDHYTSLAELPEIAFGAVAEATRARAAEARADAEQAVAGAAASIAVAVAAAVLFGRSITRPLHLLTGHARRVSDGELSIAPLPLRGPPELAVATGAFNDVIENIKLMEQKALALSRGDFSSEALAAPLPGRLGDALNDSLQLLSSSIIEREHLQSRLVHQATHDALTGLANRRAAIDALSAAVARSHRSGQPLAVTFVDLDDFKTTNDTCGHAIGDALLQAIGRRMQAAARRGDLVARLGGDEFVIITEQVSGLEEAMSLVRRVLDAVAAPIEIDGREFLVTASAGIALDLDQGDDALSLLAKADLAVYRAKQAVPSTIELYDEELQQLIRQRAETEAALAEALLAGGDQLLLHYQPILDATTGELLSLEALVRWDRPGVGLIPPDLFIPVAEGSDLILALDHWVLRTATRQMADWSEHPLLRNASLAVNISGRHITEHDFASQVASALADSQLDGHRLVLEVTETALVADLDHAAVQIDAVRALGVRVAVDDFGTGHTGLAHIRAVSIDEIKIDRSFTAELPELTHLIQIIVYLAGHLGVTTVAEGVETIAQAQMLADLGCTMLQGYLFSPALSPRQLEDWVEDRFGVASGPLAWPGLGS